MIVGTSTANDTTDGDDTLYTRGAEALIASMNLDNYEASYYGYNLFYPGSVENNYTTHVVCTPNTHLESVQGPPPPPPDATGRSFEFFNQSNCFFPVCCVLLDNKAMANAFIKKKSPQQHPSRQTDPVPHIQFWYSSHHPGWLPRRVQDVMLSPKGYTQHAVPIMN